MLGPTPLPPLLTDDGGVLRTPLELSAAAPGPHRAELTERWTLNREYSTPQRNSPRSTSADGE